MAKRLGHDWTDKQKAEAWDNEMMGPRRQLELLNKQSKEMLALRLELHTAKKENDDLRTKLDQANEMLDALGGDE